MTDEENDRMAEVVMGLSGESAKLRELLRCEYHLHASIMSPWNCSEEACPCFANPASTCCDCYMEKKRAHVAAVRKEIRL